VKGREPTTKQGRKKGSKVLVVIKSKQAKQSKDMHGRLVAKMETGLKISAMPGLWERT